MSKLTSAVRNFIRDEEGATTAEYGIIVVVMAAIAVAALKLLDKPINNLYNGAEANIDSGTTFKSNIAP